MIWHKRHVGCNKLVQHHVAHFKPCVVSLLEYVCPWQLKGTLLRPMEFSIKLQQ